VILRLFNRHCICKALIAQLSDDVPMQLRSLQARQEILQWLARSLVGLS
jgi:hypothetical protein